jgi:hypothetical protein
MEATMTATIYTAQELAAALGLSARRIRQIALESGIGQKAGAPGYSHSETFCASRGAIPRWADHQSPRPNQQNKDEEEGRGGTMRRIRVGMLMRRIREC